MAHTEAPDVPGKWNRPVARSVSATEYLIMLLLVCFGIGFGALTLSNSIAASMNNATECIKSQGVQCE